MLDGLWGGKKKDFWGKKDFPGNKVEEDVKSGRERRGREGLGKKKTFLPGTSELWNALPANLWSSLPSLRGGPLMTGKKKTLGKKQKTVFETMSFMFSPPMTCKRCKKLKILKTNKRF